MTKLKKWGDNHCFQQTVNFSLDRIRNMCYNTLKGSEGSTPCMSP